MKEFSILVVDDEQDVFLVTKLIASTINVDVEDLKLHYVNCAKDACNFLSEHQEIGLVILDIVMESDDAGFKVVDFIRNKLLDTSVHIVIRSGKTGTIPEQYLHLAKGINGYINKLDFTRIDLEKLVNQAIKEQS
ncbi:response regulator [Pseudoalteromonas sp. SSDWG2]|uniref:response regulator n=1 Tax=Pseudoalteromonas sp. SSDWG2 TaxID=3139391 RepID=UPI003BAB3938